MARMMEILAYLFLVSCTSGSGSGPVSNSGALPDGEPPGSTETKTKVFAYAGAQYANTLRGFELNKATGTLQPTQQGSIATEFLPMISAVLYNKKFILTANYTSNSISTYRIEGLTGSLSLIDHTHLGLGTAPAWIVSHPKLPIAYVAQSGASSVAILDVDPGTGLVSLRGTEVAGVGVTALEINAQGTRMYSADQSANAVSIYSIDGAGNPVRLSSGSTPEGSAPNHLKLHPSGSFLYVANWLGSSVSLYSVSGDNLSLVETTLGAGGGIYTVSISSDGKFVYGAKPSVGSLESFSVNLTDGHLTALSSEAIAGIINMNFFGAFAFLVPWANASSEYPIQTRLYNPSTGLASAPFQQTTAYRGLYQLEFVEVPQ